MDTNKIDIMINHLDWYIRTTKMELRERVI